jgi:deoxyribonuclease-4
MNRLLFGTAGSPVSSRVRTSVSGIERIKELGLGCMELEFVRGVKMGENTAKLVERSASGLHVTLSVHAPYYVNLNSSDRKTYLSSIERIKSSARIGEICGAGSIVFHPGFYMKSPKKAVYRRVEEALRNIGISLQDEGIRVILRPETTGRRTQFGSLEEILLLCQGVEGVLPCIDFSHLHARTDRNNSKEEFSAVLSLVEEKLGRSVLNNMHIHISGIKYNRTGERNHLNLLESDLRYEELLESWKEFSIKGLVICESPNLEGDALLLKERYAGLR